MKTLQCLTKISNKIRVLDDTELAELMVCTLQKRKNKDDRKACDMIIPIITKEIEKRSGA